MSIQWWCPKGFDETTCVAANVNGVLNAARPGWGAAARSGTTAYSAGQPFRLRLGTALLTRFRSLHASGLVEIRWCSTWCSDADQVERLLGLPCLHRSWHHPISPTTAAIAKLAAARTVLDQGRRLIWTDDAVPPSGPLRDERTATGRAMLIAPMPSRGLQPDAIDAFLTADNPTTRTTRQPTRHFASPAALLGEPHRPQRSA